MAVPARSLAHGVKIQPTAVAPLYCDAIVEEEFWLQGGFDPSKKSGVGVDFELFVHFRSEIRVPRGNQA